MSNISQHVFCIFLLAGVWHPKSWFQTLLGLKRIDVSSSNHKVFKGEQVVSGSVTGNASSYVAGWMFTLLSTEGWEIREWKLWLVWEPCFAKNGEASALLKLAWQAGKSQSFLVKQSRWVWNCQRTVQPLGKTLEFIPSLKLTQPLKIKFPKRKLVFQPSTFRCELLVSGRVVFFV